MAHKLLSLNGKAMETDLDSGLCEEKRALKHAQLTRLWTTISLFAVVSVLEVETISRIAFLNAHRLHCFIVTFVIGAAFFLWRQKLEHDKSGVDLILSFYRNPRYWASLLVTAAVVTQVVLPFRSPPAVIEVVRARPMVPKVEPPPAPPLPPPAPEPEVRIIEFPDLQLSGVVLNGKKSAAVLNGRTILVGEHIGGVRLIDVTETQVVVEKDRFEKTIKMD